MIYTEQMRIFKGTISVGRYNLEKSRREDWESKLAAWWREMDGARDPKYLHSSRSIR
jgi:hypothetical protein